MSTRAAVHAVLALAGGAMVSPAFADDTGGLAEVVVTAQKREESIQRVPIAVTALDAAALERSYARDIQGVAALAPNIIIDPILGNGTAAISIRGIQLNDVEKSFDPAVAVYLDGVYLANTTGALLQMFDAADIEVLRGPQGTLFGRNTIGGLLSIKRALPTGEFGGKVSVNYGRFDQLDVNAVLNLPAAMDGRLKSKLAVISQTGGGYFNNVSQVLPASFTPPFVNTSQTGKRDGNVDFQGYSLSTTLQATDALDLGLILDYFNDHSPTRPVTSLTGPLEVLCSGASAIACGAPASDTNFHASSHTVQAQPAYLRTKAATFNLNWKAAEGQKVVSVMGYRDIDEDAVQEFDGGSILPASPTFPGGTPVFITDRPQQSHQFSEELRLESDWSKTARSVFGLYYFDGSYHLHQTTWFGGAPFGSPYYKQDTKSSAAFGQFDWDFAPDWTLSLGGRYTHEKKEACAANYDPTNGTTVLSSFGTCDLGNYLPTYSYVNNAVTPAQTVTVTQTGVHTWSKFTPRVNLAYRVDEQKMVYLTYSEGFRSGGFNGRSSDPRSLGPYEPEKVKSIELGTKTQWLNNRLRFNADVFHTKYENKQEDVVFPDPKLVTVTLVQNAASATINGAEFELTAIPAHGLTIGVNIGILDAKYDSWCVPNPTTGITGCNGPGTGFSKADFKLRRSPNFTAGLNLQYEQSLANGAAIEYGANYSYKDKYYINGNTLSPYDVTPTGGFNGNPGLVKAFGDLDLSVAYDATKWKVSAWAKNVTNERHFLHVLDVGTSYSEGPNNTPVPTAGLWTFGTLNPPRTYGVSGTVKF